MLSSMKSPSEYMQAAFRAQNPYTFERDGELVQKQNAYVFDFDPTRTLTIFDDFANNLQEATANGKGTAEEHEKNIRQLLNFFPVIGEDEDGQMVELDAKQVMSIPRHLKSQEVVKRGFMSNFLFTNIGRIFSAPAEVREILNGLVTAKEEKVKQEANAIDGAEDVSVNDQGEVEVPHDRVIGKSKELFSDKVYSDLGQEVANTVENTDKTDFKSAAKKLSEHLNKTVGQEIINRVSDEYGLTKTEAKRYQRQMEKENEQAFHKLADALDDRKKLAEVKYQQKQAAAQSQSELNEAKREYEVEREALLQEFDKKTHQQLEEVVANKPASVIEQVEKHQEEQKVKNVEEDARAHLRGFSRTIPSFIMAYGNENLTLQNFDDYTEDDVFKEVTGISEEQFRFLRDGGDYVDAESGEKKHFDGHLFDEVVFNDSIQQFLDLKNRLSDYFNESNDEDIFDYIPPQKTNQIYTPKAVVKHMVDDLETNNPGIFDDPNRTFADLYMKSGLYITEIVKRLFRNEKMKQLFPDDQARIEHIMEHQVYGLAPTRIIYLIATNYIFGFDDHLKKAVLGKHFKQLDAAEYAKNGTLEEVIQKEFGGEK